MRGSTVAPMADEASVQARLQALAQEAVSVVMEADPVSYTHLTLPTLCSV